MNCGEIIKEIEKTFPLSAAEEWDNPGLLAGRREKEVRTVVVALDASDEVIDQAVKCSSDMLITHHPLIFGSLKKISSDSFIGMRLIRLIENGISCYAMHTNYDILAMADLNADMLDLKDIRILSITGENEQKEAEGLGRVGSLKKPMKYLEFAEFVKKVFELSDVRCYGEGNPQINTVALCGGSGKSLIDDVIAAGADVFVTGDIDYHTGIDACAKGVRIIDAGHFGTEHCFMDDMSARLKSMFPGLTVIRADQHAPYTLI